MNSSASHPAPLTIEVWSDVVCPWCYIGKRRLESAIAQIRARGTDLDDVVIRWRSFQLDPSAPRTGERGHGASVAEYLGQKYGGGIEAGQTMSDQMTQAAASEGLDFHLEDARVGNTVDAHRLLHLAAEMAQEDDGEPGDESAANVQDRLKERLLKAYFTQGLDVCDHAMLLDLAVEVGLTKSRVEEVLASTAYQREVAQDQAQAQAYGATGVPFTVIDQQYGVSGAQPVEVFVDTLDRAIADRAPQLLTMSPPETAAGEATQCGPDGCEVP
ncbi:MAG: DsbA family oxidoreductase [Ornithinimicrobium sp.]